MCVFVCVKRWAVGEEEGYLERRCYLGLILTSRDPGDHH